MTRTRLSAHLGYLFTELPLIDRIQAAGSAGFTAIEHPQPFSISQSDMCSALSDNGLVFTQVAAGLGDPAKGEKGLAALTGRQLEFRRNFDIALEYAVAVNARYVHPMAGIVPEALTKSISDVYLDNIDYAVKQTSGTNVTILVEAISNEAISGYGLSTLEQAVKVQDIFGPGNVSILLDTFHAAANGVVTADWITQNSHRIGHVHIADYPGRHQPGTGTIEFDAILAALKRHRYPGAIGFEYIPSTSTAYSLEFFADWKARHSRLAHE
jgi:hydroxypyruvate isomerase